MYTYDYIKFVPREKILEDTLFFAVSNYEKEYESRISMTDYHRKSLALGIKRAILLVLPLDGQLKNGEFEYNEEKPEYSNDIFGRAALIAFCWARGAINWEIFGPLTLFNTLSFFLAQEGASIAKNTTWDRAFFDFETRIREIYNKGNGILLESYWSDLYDMTFNSISEHWVCNIKNDCARPTTKHCHIPTEKRRIKRHRINDSETTSCRIECKSIDGKPCPIGSCEAKDISSEGICSKKCPANPNSILKDVKITYIEEGNTKDIFIPIAQVKYGEKRTGIKFSSPIDL